MKSEGAGWSGSTGPAQAVGQAQMKYAKALGTRTKQPCPCLRKFRRRTLVAFRFAAAAKNCADFVPVGDPVNPQPPLDTCEHFALSFFATLADARKKFASCVDRFGSKLGNVDEGLRAALERYGDSIAEVTIIEDDGLVDPASSTGHVNLHEYEDVSFVGRVTVYHPVEEP